MGMPVADAILRWAHPFYEAYIYYVRGKRTPPMFPAELLDAARKTRDARLLTSAPGPIYGSGHAEAA